MVKFDPNANYDASNPMMEYFKKTEIKEGDKILVNKKNNEVYKINIYEGIEWLNRIIVRLKVDVFKTDSPIETVFQEKIRKDYKAIKVEEKKFQEAKKTPEAFLTPKLQQLKAKVEQLNSLIEAGKKILPGQDEYVKKAKRLETKIAGETFVNQWNEVKDVNKLNSKDLAQKEEYFTKGFEYLKQHSEEIKQMIQLENFSKEAMAARDENPFYLSLVNELNVFLDNYQDFIKARFQAFDESLKQTDSVSDIVNQIADFHASIQGHQSDLVGQKDVKGIFYLVTLPSLSLRLLALAESIDMRTGDDYKKTIQTIEKHFADKVEKLSTGRSEAQKAFLQHEIASQKKSLPFDGAIKNLSEEIESYQLSVSKLRKEIESLSGQERELSEAVANNESFTGATENYLRSAANSIVSGGTDVPAEEQLVKVQEELARKTKNLNLLSDEIVQFESELKTLKKDKAQALSELPSSPQSAPEGMIKRIYEIKRELSPLLELPILEGNTNLTEQLLSLDTINRSLATEKKALEDLRKINSSWLILSENPKQLKAKEQYQYIGDGCRALQKLASMSPEGRRLTKENVDAVKFFKDSHEMLLSRSQEIDSSIRKSLSQTPPDIKAVIGSLKEYNDLKSAHAMLRKIFSGENIEKLYGYKFNQSPERLAADIQNDKLQIKFGKLQAWVFEQSGIEPQGNENEFKSNIAKLDFQMQQIEGNLKSHSEELEPVKQKKVQLENDLNAMQNLETFLKRSELKSSAEAVTEKDLRTALVAPLIEVYRKEQAIYRNTEMPLPEAEKQSVVIKDMNKRINLLNREIKAAVEVRDRYNVVVGGSVKSQKEILEKSIADLETHINNQQAIVDKEADLNAVQAELKKLLDIR